ncbi:MAG: hypothetical protein LH461_09815 [Spirochaetaceae bacterium]|nr:hypothetical protein [Spirochaetaceae bacterium]
MLITNHVLSGALIGLVAPDVGSAFGRGFVSHFILDSVPHFGVDDAHLMRVAVPDGLVGLVAIAVLARATPRRQLLPLLSGIAGACVPDLDKPGRQFFGRSPFPAWFDRAHAVIQPESTRHFPVEVAAASAFTAALLVLLRRF